MVAIDVAITTWHANWKDTKSKEQKSWKGRKKKQENNEVAKKNLQQ